MAISKHIKRPYTEQERADSSFNSHNHLHAKPDRHGNLRGWWVINGEVAMDRYGRLLLPFILGASNRKINYLRGLLKAAGQDYNFARPCITTMDAKPYKGGSQDAFGWLASRGEVKALKLLISFTDIVTPMRQAVLVRKANKCRKARTAKLLATLTISPIPNYPEPYQSPNYDDARDMGGLTISHLAEVKPPRPLWHRRLAEAVYAGAMKRRKRLAIGSTIFTLCVLTALIATKGG